MIADWSARLGLEHSHPMVTAGNQVRRYAKCLAGATWLRRQRAGTDATSGLRCWEAAPEDGQPQVFAGAVIRWRNPKGDRQSYADLHRRESSVSNVAGAEVRTQRSRMDRGAAIGSEPKARGLFSPASRGLSGRRGPRQPGLSSPWRATDCPKFVGNFRTPPVFSLAFCPKFVYKFRTEAGRCQTQATRFQR
jgi:hypothetical protein